MTQLLAVHQCPQQAPTFCQPSLPMRRTWLLLPSSHP
jgi:hypothetical protein